MQTPQASGLPGGLFVLAGLVLQAGPLPAFQARTPSAAPATGIPWWDASFDEARKRAAERNCPIAVVLVQDGEEANGRFVRGVLTSGELRAALRSAVPVLCNLGTGHATRVEDARTICAVHGAVPCGRHQELARETFEYVSEKGAISTPQIALLAPSGKVLQRVIDVPSTAEFVKAVDAAAARVGPGLSEEELAAIDALLVESARVPAHQRPAALLGRIGRVAPPPPDGPLAARIAAARKQLLAEIEQRVARAQADLAAGRFHEAVRETSFLLEDSAPQPSAAAARAILTESQKRPEGRAARERVELELKAHRAIGRAEDLARKGKRDLALREAQSALRAADGTPSDAEIRRRVDLLRAAPQGDR